MKQEISAEGIAIAAGVSGVCTVFIPSLNV